MKIIIKILLFIAFAPIMAIGWFIGFASVALVIGFMAANDCMKWLE